MPKIAIVGGGGHSKVLISIISKLTNYEIVGYTDLENQGDILGIKYLGNDNEFDLLFSNGLTNLAIGIGTINTSDLRESIYNKFTNIGFEFPEIISPKAIINVEVSIAFATMVFDGVVVNSGTNIGKGVILNTNSTIEHDCIIEDFVHIAPGVTLSGNVHIGKYSMIGAASTIVQGVNITEKVIIGAGSVVTKSILESGTYVGCPARRIS